MLLDLGEALSCWGTSRFDSTLKRLLSQQADRLPLQQALAQSSSVIVAPLTVLLRSTEDLGPTLQVRAMLLYEGRVGGCACAGDPAPETSHPESCMVQLDIDKTSGRAVCRLLND